MPKILKGLYKLPHQLDPAYPPGLEAIIVRALQHDPKDRYQDAESMRDDLEQWLWSNKHFVSPADIAKVVRERMAPGAFDTAQQLTSVGRGKSRIAMERLLESTQEEPSTAGTGIVVPEQLRAQVEPEQSPDSATAVVRTDPLSQRTIPALEWSSTQTGGSADLSDFADAIERPVLSLVPPPAASPPAASPPAASLPAAPPVSSPRQQPGRAVVDARAAAHLASMAPPRLRKKPKLSAMDEMAGMVGWLGLGSLVLSGLLWWIFR
jgi:serine/threonine-protein kinase